MAGYKVLHSHKLYDGRVFDLIVDEIEYDSGNRAVREVARHAGGSVVVPVMPNGTLLLIRQYRYPIHEFIYELPAGKLGPGEDPDSCARRELLEETGYVADAMTPLGSILTSPGFCTERLHLFLARGLRPEGSGQKLEEGELSLTVEPVPFTRALEMVRAGAIVDAKTICGILMARDRLGQ